MSALRIDDVTAERGSVSMTVTLFVDMDRLTEWSGDPTVAAELPAAWMGRRRVVAHPRAMRTGLALEGVVEGTYRRWLIPSDAPEVRAALEGFAGGVPS